MPVTLLVKGLDNRHVSKFNFLLRILRKLRQPATDLLFFVDIRGREWVLTPKSLFNLLAEPLCGFTSLTTISIPGDVISSFVDRREGKK